MKAAILTAAAALVMAASAGAQEASKLNIKLGGRILMDAGLFDADHQNNKLNDGVAIPDMRVGFKASYGNWQAKVDIGYAYGKVSMKDVFLQYDLGKNDFLRGGYFVHQFGYQSATSSSFKVSMEEPASQTAFGDSRLLGLMYAHDKKSFLGTVSLFAENNSMKLNSNSLGNQGVGVMTRLVYHPFTEAGKILQAGISGAFETPQYNDDDELSHKSYVLAANYPLRVASVKAQEATVTNANALWKFSPEVALSVSRFALEAQYYWLGIDRDKGCKNYKASGAYATLRGLVKGKNYSYAHFDGGIATPAPGSMEVVAAYNYTDLSDHDAQIRGGRMNDWSLTYNWYLNKYMIWRVRASHTKTTDRAGFENNKLNLIETRIQIKF